MIEIPFKRLLIPLATAFACSAAFAVCDFTNSCFSGTAGCTDDKCGIGCYESSFGADLAKCYTSPSAECCLCVYRNDTCDCTFGPGSQRITQRYSLSWTTCNGGASCGTGCIGFTPNSLPVDP